jgi:hypothetical protein
VSAERAEWSLHNGSNSFARRTTYVSRRRCRAKDELNMYERNDFAMLNSDLELSLDELDLVLGGGVASGTGTQTDEPQGGAHAGGVPPGAAEATAAAAAAAEAATAEYNRGEAMTQNGHDLFVTGAAVLIGGMATPPPLDAGIAGAGLYQMHEGASRMDAGEVIMENAQAAYDASQSNNYIFMEPLVVTPGH